MKIFSYIKKKTAYEMLLGLWQRRFYINLDVSWKINELVKNILDRDDTGVWKICGSKLKRMITQRAENLSQISSL